jgi:hypothetical protein
MWLLFKLRPSGGVQKPLQYINILYWYMSRQVDIWKCEIIDLWGSSSSPGELFQWLKPDILYKVQQQFENNTYEFKVYNTHRSQTRRVAPQTQAAAVFFMSQKRQKCGGTLLENSQTVWWNRQNQKTRVVGCCYHCLYRYQLMELIFWISSKCGVSFLSHVGLV